MSGVRSSCEASATKRRSRSSLRSLASRARCCSSNEVSIWSSMLSKAVPRRPTSVSSWGTPARCDRSPAVIWSAVCRDPLQRQQPAPDHEPGDQQEPGHRERADDEQGPDQGPLGRLDARQRRGDRQDHVRLVAPFGEDAVLHRAVDRRPLLDDAEGLRRDPGRVDGEGREGIGVARRSRTGTPGSRCRACPGASPRCGDRPRCRSSRAAARRWILVAPSVMDSSSRSTRSTRLARVSWTTRTPATTRAIASVSASETSSERRLTAAHGRLMRRTVVAGSGAVVARAGRSRSRGPSAAGAAPCRRACGGGS